MGNPPALRPCQGETEILKVIQTGKKKKRKHEREWLLKAAFVGDLTQNPHTYEDSMGSVGYISGSFYNIS